MVKYKGNLIFNLKRSAWFLVRQPLKMQVLPAITGQNVFDDNLPNLMRLPARLGGLGITDPSQKSSTFYENSKLITAPIVNIIIDQSRVSPP